MLVTHGIGFLPQCDQIMSMSEGSITEMGMYDELIRSNGDFAEFIHVFSNTEENKEGDSSGEVPPPRPWAWVSEGGEGEGGGGIWEEGWVGECW